MNYRSFFYYLLFSFGIISCASIGKKLTKVVNSEMVYSKGYFQKVLPLICWHSLNRSDIYSTAWETTNPLFYETDALYKKGYLVLVDSVRTNMYGKDGMKLFYEVNVTAKKYLTGLHYDSLAKRNDSASFNAYQLLSVKYDSSYNYSPENTVDIDGNRIVYDDIIIGIFRIKYEVTPLFSAYQNPKLIHVNFKRYSKKSDWEFEFNSSKAMTIIGIYNALSHVYGTRDHYEENIIFPPDIREWLQKWWLRRRISSHK